MYKEIRDENAEKMRDLAKTIRPTTETSYHAAEATMPSDSLAKAGPLVSQFFDLPEVSVQDLDTNALITTLGGGDDARAARFREKMKALYPGFPSLWDMKIPTAPMVGNMASRTVDASDASTGGQHWPSAGAGKALAVALQRNEAAKALKKAASGGDAEGELGKYRESIFRLMPDDVRRHYLNA
jgi:hypothetical protein